MKVRFLTLFPEMFPSFLGCSLAGRALEKGLWSYEVVNIRDYATDAYKTVDDVPFGGGAGMVMIPDVLDRTLRAQKSLGRLIYMSPRGRRLTQDLVLDLAKEQEITILCGRFEGVDERVLNAYAFEEISVGDFVLSGGEPAALTMMDAVLRYVPGVLGNADSLSEESFANGLLEYPQYTRPAVWNGVAVPDVLLSGHHKNIQDWRKNQSEQITKQRRPDIYEKYLATNKK